MYYKFFIIAFLSTAVFASGIDTLADSTSCEFFTQSGKRLSGFVVSASRDSFSLAVDSETFSFAQGDVAAVRELNEADEAFVHRAAMAFYAKRRFRVALETWGVLLVRGNPSDSTLYFVSQCLMMLGELKQSLGVNYGNKNPGDPLKPAVAFQRFELFRIMGMEKRARRIAKKIARDYPRTAYSRQCREFLKKRWEWMVPDMKLGVRADYGRRESQLREDLSTNDFSQTDSNFNVLQTDLKATTSASCRWQILGTQTTKIKIGPALRFRLPYDQESKERHTLGAGIDWTHDPSPGKTQMANVSYGRGTWNDSDPVDEYVAFWSYGWLSESSKFYLLSLMGLVMNSDDEFQRIYFLHASTSALPLVQISKRITLNSAASAVFFSPFAPLTTNQPLKMVFADSIVEGATRRSAIIYTDSTCQSVFYDNPLAHPHSADFPSVTVAERLLGTRSSLRYLGMELEMDLKCSLSELLALGLENSVEIHLYPDEYAWDNTEGSPRMDSSRGYVFVNKADGLEYDLWLDPDQPLSRTEYYRRYEPVELTRIDTRLTIRTVLSTTKTAFGRFRIYIDTIAKFSTADGKGPFAFGYREIAPGLIWNTTF